MTPVIITNWHPGPDGWELRRVVGGWALRTPEGEYVTGTQADRWGTQNWWVFKTEAEALAFIAQASDPSGV